MRLHDSLPPASIDCTISKKVTNLFLQKFRFFELASYDGPIIITSRNMKNGEGALEKLRAEYSTADFHLHQLDLVDVASRKAIVEYVRTTFGKIAILINNGGFAHYPGAEVPFDKKVNTTMDINFFSTKDFTNEMAELITDRVVTVASFVTDFHMNQCSEEIQNFFKSGPKTEDEITEFGNDFVKFANSGVTENEVHKYSMFNASYTMSKMLIRKMTEAQAKKWPHLKVFSADPGYCKSDMSGFELPPKYASDGADNFWWLATTQDADVCQKC